MGAGTVAIVKAVQQDLGIAVTGVVDAATVEVIDKKLGGLHPSDLVILAGRPSMGKTSLATNIAFYAAKAHKPARRPDGRIDINRAAEDGAALSGRLLRPESGSGGQDRSRFPR